MEDQLSQNPLIQATNSRLFAPHKKACQERGFSLLEVLVAFSILALSLAVLFQIYSHGTKSISLSRDYSKALIIAESQLASLDLENTIELGEKTGRSEDGISWQQRVYNDENEDNTFQKNYQLVNVEVEVSWKTLGKKRSLTLHSKRLSGIR